MDVLEVARFSTLPEADLAVSLLRSHGIEAELADRGMATANPLLQGAIGNVRVIAPDHQIREARSLISRARQGEFADTGDGNDGEWMIDATPGKVGELDDEEVHGALTGMKTIVRVVIIGLLALPVAVWIVITMFG